MVGVTAWGGGEMRYRKNLFYNGGADEKKIGARRPATKTLSTRDIICAGSPYPWGKLARMQWHNRGSSWGDASTSRWTGCS